MSFLVFILSWNWPLRSSWVYLNADEVLFDVHAHYHEGDFQNEQIGPCRSSCHGLTQVEIIQGHIHFIQIFLCIVPNFGGGRGIVLEGGNRSHFQTREESLLYIQMNDLCLKFLKKKIL